jgi:hypothetical protein
MDDRRNHEGIQMTQITHESTAESQAFEKISTDLKRCFATWEVAGIQPSLAMWAMTVLITESLRSAFDGDRGRIVEFMLAAMNSSLSEAEAKN